MLSVPTDARLVAAVLLSPFVAKLTPDTRLFAGAIVAIIAVNAVRPCCCISQEAYPTKALLHHMPESTSRAGGCCLHRFCVFREACRRTQGGLAVRTNRLHSQR